MDFCACLCVDFQSLVHVLGLFEVCVCVFVLKDSVFIKWYMFHEHVIEIMFLRHY